MSRCHMAEGVALGESESTMRMNQGLNKQRSWVDPQSALTCVPVTTDLHVKH